MREKTRIKQKQIIEKLWKVFCRSNSNISEIILTLRSDKFFNNSVDQELI